MSDALEGGNTLNEETDWRLPDGPDDRLTVLVNDWFGRAPKIPGWEVFWVNVNLERNPAKKFIYHPAKEKECS